jgi:CBS domain containing-hemolysin-like protein
VNILDGAVIVALLLVNGFFVAAEFTLISARRTAIAGMAAEGSRRARTVLTAMDSVPHLIAGAQLGVTLASLALGALGEPVIADALEPVFHAMGLPENLLHPVSFALALTLVVSGHILIGEMVPKNLALASPERAALWLVPPLHVISRAIRPLLNAIRASADGVLRLLRIPPTTELHAVYTAEELPALIQESRERRLLDQDEHDLMIATLALYAAPVGSVMTPLERVTTVPAGTTGAQLQAYAARHRHSRYPIAGAQAGRLEGYLHVLDGVNATDRDAALPARPLPHLPETATLVDVLATMRSARAQLTAITGAGGAVIGVATLGNLLASLTTTPAATGDPVIARPPG